MLHSVFRGILFFKPLGWGPAVVVVADLPNIGSPRTTVHVVFREGRNLEGVADDFHIMCAFDAEQLESAEQ